MKRIWILSLTGLAVVALTVSVAAADAPQTRALSLEDCIKSALEKNLDLQIARYNVPMARMDLQAAYAGYDPSFSISGQHNFSLSSGGFNSSADFTLPPSVMNENSFKNSLGGSLPWGLSYTLSGNVAESHGSFSGSPFVSSSGAASINLTQPLLKNLWIDQTRLNIRVYKNRLKYSELGLKQIIMATVTTVEQAYYDLIYDREFVKVEEKAVELATRLVDENKKRVEVGAMAPLDEQQAESQAASSQADLISARISLAAQENTVKQLISDHFSQWEKLELLPTDTLLAQIQVFDRQNSWNKGLTQRPDFLQAKLDVEKQGVTLKYNYNQLFPELDLVGSYGHNAGGVNEFSEALGQLREGSQPFYYYGAQLTMPLANTGARATYKKSKLSLEQLKLTLKKLEQTIMVAIDNDIKQAQSNYERVAATRAAREYAEAALAAEQKKLDTGKSTTYTVLQMQRDLTAARGSEIQALDNYNKALSQLSLDEGSTLDRLNISVEVK